MIRLRLDGIWQEVDQTAFLRFLPIPARNMTLVARALLDCYRRGDFDQRQEIRGYFLQPEELQLLLDVIQHAYIKEMFEIIKVKVAPFKLDDDRITSLLTRQGIRPHGQSGSAASKGNPFTGAAQHEYRLRLDELDYMLWELQGSQLDIEENVQRLIASPDPAAVKDNSTLAFSTSFSLPEFPGEDKPRRRAKPYPDAKSLIDAASGEPDAQRAIRLLKRAMTYDRSSDLASIAYFELGLRYDDAGEHKRAVGYYTKSLKIFGPSAEVLLGRGEAYYHKGQFQKASKDLQQAITLGLDDEDREQASGYLQEIEIQESKG